MTSGGEEVRIHAASTFIASLLQKQCGTYNRKTVPIRSRVFWLKDNSIAERSNGW
jgi:hypothetical protein